MDIFAINRTGSMDHVETLPDNSLPEAIQDILNMYWEEENQSGFIFRNEEGRVVATMITLHSDGVKGRVAVTVYDGAAVRMNIYDVEYMLTQDGYWDHTEINEVS